MRKANYSIYEKIKNVIFLCVGKIIVPKSRLIRFPIIIRGKKYIDFGNRITTGARCRFEVNGYHKTKKLIFGENVNIGYDVRISCCEQIIIGSNVLIGSRVTIIDNSHGNYSNDNQDSPYTPPNEREIFHNPIKIEDNVWIGDNVVIQQGVTIGFGSIIAANTVVTKDVGKNTIVGGIPARIIKKYDSESRKWLRNNQN